MIKLLLESCVENFDGALTAQQNGADRVELCDNLAVGGTTPSFATIEYAKKYLNIPQAVIIRARGGNFEYTDIEKEIMLKDIALADNLEVAGLVVGALQNGSFDKDFMSKARDLAKNAEIISHMAFDSTVNMIESLDFLISLGYNRVLTKGGSGSASENLDKLKELITHANDRITILVGGGVTKNNVNSIASYTGAKELHGKLIV